MNKQLRIVAALIIMVAMSTNMEMAAEAGPGDCYDACSTACVQRDTRLMARCDRKCQIRCAPDSEAEKERGA